MTALLVALGACLVMFGYASSPVWAADRCSNATLRAQNNSSRLPDCRAYEMVSPPYKEGFGITPQSYNDDGAVSFTSPGIFAGNAYGVVFNEYVTRRSSAGWTTVSPAPPASIFDTSTNAAVEGLSADFGTSLWVSRRRVAPADVGLYFFYLHRPDGAMTRVGPGAVPGLPEVSRSQVPFTQGASADLSHVLFSHGPDFGTNYPDLYEYVGTGNEGPARRVSVDNNGATLGACPAGMSVDGRVIVFRSGCGGPLWARVAGSATVAVSGSECTRSSADPAGACSGATPANYVGMAADGSRVFFITDQQLVNGDTDTSSDLYACEIPDGAPAPVGATNPCSSLIDISGVAGAARVQGVAAVSDDGSRVYFVANGVLADNFGTNDAPAVDGQANLYLWTRDAAHPTGQVTFITNLSGGFSRAQATADGGYLVLATTSRLVTAGPGADTDDASDVYRYDADGQAIVRLSTGVSGGGGNTVGVDATLNGLSDKDDQSVQRSNRRSLTAMTADGSTVVFVTAEALSPEDIDGVSDVYVWRDGHVSLVSDGVGGGAAPWVTRSGRDIFFTTGARLTALDGDVNGDVYDARVGGGFDLTRAVPCAGDDCQGQPALVPGFPGGSSGVSEAHVADKVVPAFSLVAVSAAQRKRLAATGKVTLAVKTNTPGMVRVAATVTGLSRVGSARKDVVAAGTVRIALSLSGKARDRLASRGRLAVRLVVGHSKVALVRSATLRLTHAKAKTKTKAKARSTGGSAVSVGGGRRS
ncbi:MAG TPA: hypothetical protein VFY45_03495 [Baekduia sp.]|nr:hypothetical protein [Baekduia sp.]